MSWDGGDYFATSFLVHKWRRYHQKRHDYYHRLHIWRALVSIFCGSGAFVVFLQTSAPGLAATLSAGCALSAALDLIFRCERAAQSHHSANRAFTDLAAKLERWDPTSKNLKKAREERLRIVTDPPQVTRLLVELMAHNEEARSRGVPEAELVPLSAAQRSLGHFCTFGMKRIEKWKAKNEVAQQADTDKNKLATQTCTMAEPEQTRSSYGLLDGGHQPA